MAVQITWRTGYCEYQNEETRPNVKVTTLHYECTGFDDAVENGATGRVYGTVNAADQNRVYALPALMSVPASVMTGWVKQALGQEEVDSIEATVAAQIEEGNNPTYGGLVPAE